MAFWSQRSLRFSTPPPVTTSESNGTHIYPGTDLQSVDDSRAAVENSLEMSARFPDIEFLDLGGGFPIERSRFDLDQYRALVQDSVTRFRNALGRQIRLMIEPGRAVFGDSAVFVTAVTDVKRRPDRRIIGVDSSSTVLPRALFYESFNPRQRRAPIRPVRRRVRLDHRPSGGRLRVDHLLPAITSPGRWVSRR